MNALVTQSLRSPTPADCSHSIQSASQTFYTFTNCCVSMNFFSSLLFPLTRFIFLLTAYIAIISTRTTSTLCWLIFSHSLSHCFESQKTGFLPAFILCFVPIIKRWKLFVKREREKARRPTLKRG